MAAALRDRFGAEEEAFAFFGFLATPRRLLQAYELLFWDTLAEGDS